MQGRRRFLLRIQRRLPVRRQLTRIHCGCNCSHFDYKYESKSYIIRHKKKYPRCVSLPYMVCQFALHESKSVSLPSFTLSEKNPCMFLRKHFFTFLLHYTSSPCVIDTIDILSEIYQLFFLNSPISKLIHETHKLVQNFVTILTYTSVCIIFLFHKHPTCNFK